MLPDFPLAFWELSPDLQEPLTAPAQFSFRALWHERETEFLARTVAVSDTAEELFLCPLNEQSHGNWWVGQCTYRRNSPAMRLSLLRSRAEMALQNRTEFFRRLCVLRSGSGFRRLSIDANGKGKLSVEGYADTDFDFPFDFPAPFFEVPAALIHQKLLFLWDDPASDLSFARRWADLPRAERYAQATFWRCGNQPQMEEVMERIGTAFFDHLQLEHPALWCFYVRHHVFSLLVFPPGQFHPDAPDLPEFWAKWEQELASYFAPTLNEPLLARHPCVRSHFAQGSDYFCARWNQPSAHETIEAALWLDSWLDERQARGEMSACIVADLRATLP